MNVDLQFDYSDALKRVNYSQAQVDSLRESARKIVIIPKSLTNKQLLVFLHTNDGDVDKAVHMLTKHYEIRKKAPQLFTKRDATRPEIKNSLANQYYLHLPVTPNDHLICFHGLSTPVAKNYFYDHATACFLVMLGQYISKHGPSNGLILLYDMKNFNSGHMFRNNLRSMRKFFQFIQEGIPIKVHQVHIFNTVPFFHLVMAVIKPAMNPELVQRMHLHSSSLDYEKFHAEHLPRSCLPAEFGGVCDSIEVLREEFAKEMLEEREFYSVEERQANLELDM